MVFATGREIPYDVETINRMQDNVHNWFPNYRQNKSLQARNVYKGALELIDVGVNESNLEEYMAQWKKIVDANPQGI